MLFPCSVANIHSYVLSWSHLIFWRTRRISGTSIEPGANYEGTGLSRPTGRHDISCLPDIKYDWSKAYIFFAQEVVDATSQKAMLLLD